MPRQSLAGIVDLCHAHDVKVSTGGFIEYVLAQGEDAVDRYLRECREVGFDIVEISTGFITVPVDDVVRLTERVRGAGLTRSRRWASSSARAGPRTPISSRRRARAIPGGRSRSRAAAWTQARPWS